MEYSARNKLLYLIEESRNKAIRLDRLNNESPVYSREQNERIYRYKQVLDQLEEYLQRSNENQSFDMTNFNQAKEELSKEIENFDKIETLIYNNNSETNILDKVLTTEIHYLKYKKEDMFFSRIEKISNTSKQLDNGILKVLAKCIDEKYSQNYKNTGERLIDDYTQILLKDENKIKMEKLITDVEMLFKECYNFKQETKQVQYEKNHNRLMQLMDNVIEEFISFDYSNNYLYQFSNAVEEMMVDNSNENNNFEDAQIQKNNLIWKMERAKEDVSNLKNEILISETIENVNKTKEQLGIMKIMGINVELIELYSAFTNAHLDNLQNAAEQMHYLNKEELLQEIGNIKTENKAFQQEVEQQRNQEQ